MEYIEDLYHKFLKCQGITTDTRSNVKNKLFVALKGPNFNANSFANSALIKGANYVVIDDPSYQSNDSRVILVKDSLKCLQKLANFHRKKLNTKFIAITGSNGKTTTKELFDAVLSKKYQTKATFGNLNNHIGVPLTLLSIKPSDQIAIIEMGANHLGEIKLLSSIIEPDIGYITNFGKAHLEGFGSKQGVIKGKSELYDFLTKHNRIALINQDDPIQTNKTTAIKKFSFGQNALSDLRVAYPKNDTFAKVTYNNTSFNSKLTGTYNQINIAASIAIGRFLEVNSNDIKKAISDYTPNNNRSQIILKNNLKIILDAYNANPTSMGVAIDNLLEQKEQFKIAILGDMYELGQFEKKEHLAIIKRLHQKKTIDVYFIGEKFYKNKIESEHCFFFKSLNDFINSNQSIINPSEKNCILIKGSRKMKLEQLIEQF